MRQYYSIEAGTDKALSDTDMAIVRAGVSGIYSFGEDEKHQVLGSLNGGYIWADDFYDVPYKLRFFLQVGIRAFVAMTTRAYLLWKMGI